MKPNLISNIFYGIVLLVVLLACNFTAFYISDVNLITRVVLVILFNSFAFWLITDFVFSLLMQIGNKGILKYSITGKRFYYWEDFNSQVTYANRCFLLEGQKDTVLIKPDFLKFNENECATYLKSVISDFKIKI